MYQETPRGFFMVGFGRRIEIECVRPREYLRHLQRNLSSTHKFARQHFLFGWRVKMSSRSRLNDSHHSTLHAFFLAAKDSGYTEFKLRLVTSPKGRVEFCLSPREHSEMSAKFEVRGNMVRAAASDASVVPAGDTDFGIYGGTRSGEIPLRVSPSP